MRLAVVLGFNQVLSHGFGIFLFAALFPMMRETTALEFWHLALIGACTQLAYLAGALVMGAYGHRFATERLMLLTGGLSSVLLLALSQLVSPLPIMLCLTLLAASAAVCWASIVELINRYSKPEHSSTHLSTSASGTAWGYGVNGMLLLWVVPVLGWQLGWLLAGSLGLAVVMATWLTLRSLWATESTLVTAATSATGDSAPTDKTALPTATLLKTVVMEPRARFSTLVCLLVGLTCMPFTSWLNSFLQELDLPPELAGYTWTALGISGALTGLTAGKLADKKGHLFALLVIFTAFALGLSAFSLDPARFAILAGICYGLMYFPVWGIVASWLAQRYSSIVTMQICGIGMVASGLGGASGNLLAGYLQALTGSLQSLYLFLAAAACVLLMLGLLMLKQSKRESVQATPQCTA